MNQLLRRSTLLAVLLIAVSIGMTLFVGMDALHVGKASDQELLAQMRGAAYEDIYGFGYWPSVGVALGVQLPVVAAIWFILRRSRWRYIALGCLLAFAFVAVVQYSGHQRQLRLWSSVKG